MIREFRSWSWARRALTALPRMALAVGMFLTWTASGTAQTPVVRLQVVNVPVDSGLLDALLPEFEASTGYTVQVQTGGENLYQVVRQGKADLVISHYGHAGVEAFMADGLGLWPRALFANQSVLIGPRTDPAGIQGLDDAVEAFRRIAQTRSPFLVNNAPGEKYLAQFLWEAAGRPDPGNWLIDSGQSNQQVVQAANRMQAYFLWGLIPFLKFKESSPSTLEALVANDAVFQRSMVSIVVNPEKISGVNIGGAIALQSYLSAPSTQAKVRAFRHNAFDQQLFWPIARDNSTSFLADAQAPPGSASDPIATSIHFEPAEVRPGESVRATFNGVNLAADTYFDVRFRPAGGNTDQLALNWQQGLSQTHVIAPGTPPGTYTVTGIRAHQFADDHSGPFIPVSGSVMVLK